MQNLTEEDVAKYLMSGDLTQPFLDENFIEKKLSIDYKSKQKQKIVLNKIECLFNWIHHNLKYCNDREFVINNQFGREAKEIWESGLSTGCTDYALVFCTLARQLNIPTTILHTAEYNWVKRLQNHEDCQMHYGHTFCECFFEGKWILVDPTCNKIEYSYNPKKIILNYQVGKHSVFIPYFRGADLKYKQTVKQHNQSMDEECILIDL